MAYMILFAASLTGLLILFSLKYVESSSGRVMLPQVRQSLNFRALGIRRSLLVVVKVIEHLPTFLVASGYALLHLSALLVAFSARVAEREAHRVADFVSHKRKFERRETQSAFLKEVSTHKEALEVPEDITKLD